MKKRYRKRRGLRNDKVFFCTTVFFAVLLVIMFIFMDKNYNDLLEVNEQLMETIDNNRITYNKNIEQVNYQNQEYYDKYCEEYSLRMRLEDVVKNNSTFLYSNEEIILLAKCVQAEAGNPQQHGNSQKLVCKVILNRVESSQFPDTIEEVIYQNDKSNGGIQFSVAYDGALEEQVLDPQTLVNVYEVLAHGYNAPQEIQYFYSASLEEDNWVKKLKVYDTVEGTIFCYNEVIR